MAKRCGTACWWRIAAISAATLCFTTIALPFSPVRLTRRTKLISEKEIVGLAVKPNSQPVMNAYANLRKTASSQLVDLDKRLQSEYGAILKAQNGVALPPREMFSSDEEARQWRANIETSSGDYVLQSTAAEALNAAREEAQAEGLDITPRDTDAAARDYAYTVELWMSRVNPGLDHWIKRGRLDFAEAERIRALPSRQQTVAILHLEEQGMFFSKDFSKSILCSVAPPGASQHLALLAFDVKEHQDRRVREILARHGWYQTVLRDEPHFTYLGVQQSQLPSLGLMRKTSGQRIYWVPGPASLDDTANLVASR